MVHNGIEYGLMQAYAEGYELLAAKAFDEEGNDLAEIAPFVEDSGEGRWTVNAAVDEAVPAEVLTAALYTRFRSRQSHTFAEKILSAMRDGFGGHKEPGKP
jgi:6-phosphogluconate dehydrogenase